MGKEKLPPQNIKAEVGVLGSMIIDPEVIPTILTFLFAEDFYRFAHRQIYEAIVTLSQQREPADFITICDELERQGKLEEVGGASYITSLTNAVPTSGNAEHYGHIVERASILRTIIHRAGEVAALAYEDDADAEVVLNQTEALFRAIGNRHTRNMTQDFDEILGEYLAELDAMCQQYHGLTITGVPTGFSKLDVTTGGLQKSDLIILAARPGEGKTSLALSIADQVAQFNTGMGYKGLFISVEMSKKQLAQRWTAMNSGVDQSRMRTLNLMEGEWTEIANARDRFGPGRLWVNDESRMTVQKLASIARRQQAEYGLDIIYVDYAQLLKALDERGRPYATRFDEVTAISGELKAIARELNVPVLVLAQLSRAVENRQDKVPVLADLRETGAFEQDADIVMFIYRNPNEPATPEGYPMDLLIAKHRNGPREPVKLFFRPKETRFVEIDWRLELQNAPTPPWSEGDAAEEDDE